MKSVDLKMKRISKQSIFYTTNVYDNTMVFQAIQKTSSETAFDGGKMQLIFIRIKMFLVCQFLTIKHYRAKIQVLKIYQVQFQGRTRNASLRRNRKSEQYQRAKWRWIYNKHPMHLTLQLQSLALKYQTTFTFDSFKFAAYRNIQELIGDISNALNRSV